MSLVSVLCRSHAEISCRNWPAKRKWLYTMVLGFMTFVVSFASSVFGTGVDETSREFHVSSVVMLLGKSKDFSTLYQHTNHFQVSRYMSAGMCYPHYFFRCFGESLSGEARRSHAAFHCCISPSDLHLVLLPALSLLDPSVSCTAERYVLGFVVTLQHH